MNFFVVILLKLWRLVYSRQISRLRLKCYVCRLDNGAGVQRTMSKELLSIVECWWLFCVSCVGAGPLMDHSRGSCIEDQLTAVPNRKLLMRTTIAILYCRLQYIVYRHVYSSMLDVAVSSMYPGQIPSICWLSFPPPWASGCLSVCPSSVPLPLFVLAHRKCCCQIAQKMQKNSETKKCQKSSVSSIRIYTCGSWNVTADALVSRHTLRHAIHYNRC